MSDEIVLNFHDTILHDYDLQILKGRKWITDSIISFYFEYLEYVAHKDKNDLLFVRPEVTQCIKMLSAKEVGIFLDPLDLKNKKLIFFPVNDNNSSENAGGCHWSLLVFSKAEKTFYYFDSIDKQNYDPAEILKSKLSDYCKGDDKKGDYGIMTINTLQQENGYDCGIHLLCNVDVVVEHFLKNGTVLPDCPLANMSVVNRKRADLISNINYLNSLE